MNTTYFLLTPPPSPSTEYGFPEYGIREMFYLMFVCQDFLDEVTPPHPPPDPTFKNDATSLII